MQTVVRVALFLPQKGIWKIHPLSSRNKPPFTFSNPRELLRFLKWNLQRNTRRTSICVIRNLRKDEQQPTTTIFASADMSPRCLRCWAQNLRFETFNCRFANLFGVLNGEQEVSANYKTQGLLCVIGTVAKADNFFDIKTWLKKSCGVWLLHQYFPRMKIFLNWRLTHPQQPLYGQVMYFVACMHFLGYEHSNKQTDFICDLQCSSFSALALVHFQNFIN